MSALTARDRLIVALDMGRDDALELCEALSGHVRWMKVGMTLFYRCGPQIVSDITAMGFDVFLDLKLHDIPHQVRGAADSVAGLGAGMLTVHASGGTEMMAAAVEGAAEGAARAGIEPPSVIAVTVLTSMDDMGLRSIGASTPAAEQVARLGALAKAAGVDGVVCSPQEAGAMRLLLGDGALVVTPGVRPAGSDRGDQSRVATPAQALSAGSSHLVIGRPITASADPVQAVASILAEMEA